MIFSYKLNSFRRHDYHHNVDIPKDAALRKVKPDKTFYLAYDINRVPHPNYHHEKFYPFETMELIDRETNIPQFNHITSEVISSKNPKYVLSNIFWSNYI